MAFNHILSIGRAPWRALVLSTISTTSKRALCSVFSTIRAPGLWAISDHLQVQMGTKMQYDALHLPTCSHVLCVPSTHTSCQLVSGNVSLTTNDENRLDSYWYVFAPLPGRNEARLYELYRSTFHTQRQLKVLYLGRETLSAEAQSI